MKVFWFVVETEYEDTRTTLQYNDNDAINGHNSYFLIPLSCLEWPCYSAIIALRLSLVRLLVHVAPAGLIPRR